MTVMITDRGVILEENVHVQAKTGVNIEMTVVYSRLHHSGWLSGKE